MAKQSFWFKFIGKRWFYFIFFFGGGGSLTLFCERIFLVGSTLVTPRSLPSLAIWKCLFKVGGWVGGWLASWLIIMPLRSPILQAETCPRFSSRNQDRAECEINVEVYFFYRLNSYSPFVSLTHLTKQLQAKPPFIRVIFFLQNATEQPIVPNYLYAN